MTKLASEPSPQSDDPFVPYEYVHLMRNVRAKAKIDMLRLAIISETYRVQLDYERNCRRLDDEIARLEHRYAVYWSCRSRGELGRPHPSTASSREVRGSAVRHD
jgi:hypothetical protein